MALKCLVFVYLCILLPIPMQKFLISCFEKWTKELFSLPLLLPRAAIVAAIIRFSLWFCFKEIFSLWFHFKRNSDDLNLFVSIYWFHFKEILNLFVSICNDPWHNVPWVVAQSLPNICQIKITKSVLNKKLPEKFQKHARTKENLVGPFLSINQHQSALVSINQHIN